MELLIIGGTGVISSAIVSEAVNNSINVTCINRGRVKIRQQSNRCNVIISDINNVDYILENIGNKEFDAVIDFISYTPSDIINRMSWAHKVCKQFFFISSTAVYNLSEDSVYDEESPKINKYWDYSVNKNNCENILIEECNKYNINYTILRPSVTYDNTRIPYAIMPPYGKHWTFISRILNKKPIVTWNNGSNIVTVTRVEDFAIATVKLIGNPQAYNEAFNVVGDIAVKWSEIIEELGSILNTEPVMLDISIEDYQKELGAAGELTGRCYNKPISNKKIKKIAPDFRTTVDLRTGLNRVINHYKENNYLDGIDYFYDGLHDRIIAKHSRDKSKCKFINYLGTATASDRIRYYVGYYSNIKVILITYKVFRKIGLIK